MRKLTLSIFIALAMQSVLFAQNEKNHARNSITTDSIVCSKWNATNNLWEEKTKNIRKYESNNMIELLSLSWNAPTWDTLSKQMFHYDSYGNQVSQIFFRTNGTNLIKNDSSHNSFDTNGNLLEGKTFIWNGTSYDFIYKSIFNYDTANNKTSREGYSWDGANWNLDLIISYSWDINRNKISEIKETCSGANCTYEHRYSYSYNSNNKLIAELHESWNGTNWVNDFKRTDTYDLSNNRILTFNETWDNITGWVNSSKAEFTYNSDNKPLIILNYQWINNNSWWAYNRFTNIYNGNGLIFSYIQESGDYNGVFVPSDKCDGNFAAYACSAQFTLVRDSTTSHHWFALNQATGTAPLSYTWNWGDGNTSTGAYPSHTYNADGYYYICLTITDANGCTDTYCSASTYVYKKGAIITIDVIQSLKELDNHHFSIYPNPTNNHLNITTTLQGNGEIQYQIINTFGATAMASKATAKDFSIDVSTLPAGIYLINLQSGTAKTIKRFVKE